MSFSEGHRKLPSEQLQGCKAKAVLSFWQKLFEYGCAKNMQILQHKGHV